eukprot:6213923-Pleurochrysis_carterae.AAC.2
MHSFSNCIRIACVLAECKRSAHLSKFWSPRGAHGRPRLSAPDTDSHFVDAPGPRSLQNF